MLEPFIAGSQMWKPPERLRKVSVGIVRLASPCKHGDPWADQSSQTVHSLVWLNPMHTQAIGRRQL